MNDKYGKGDGGNQRGKADQGRALMMQGTLAAQTIERAGLEGTSLLLVLGLSCLSGLFFFFLVWKILQYSWRYFQVALWLIRIRTATRQAKSSIPAMRRRGRGGLQSCAVRLRDRPT